MPMNYWLFKTEPDVYSIDDLKSEKKNLKELKRYAEQLALKKTALLSIDFYHERVLV